MSSTQPFNFDPEKTVHQQPSPASPEKKTATGKSKQGSVDKIAKQIFPSKVEAPAEKVKKLARNVSEYDEGSADRDIENVSKVLNPAKKEKIEQSDGRLDIDTLLNSAPTAPAIKAARNALPCTFTSEGILEPGTDHFVLTAEDDDEFVFEIEYMKQGKDNKPQMIIILPHYLFRDVESDTGMESIENVTMTTFQLTAFAISPKEMWDKFDNDSLIDLYSTLQKLSTTLFADGPKEITVPLNKAIANLEGYLKL